MRSYKLLKDLPGAEAGLVLDWDTNEKKYIVRGGELEWRFSLRTINKNPQWFGTDTEQPTWVDEGGDIPSILKRLGMIEQRLAHMTIYSPPQQWTPAQRPNVPGTSEWEPPYKVVSERGERW